MIIKVQLLIVVLFLGACSFSGSRTPSGKFLPGDGLPKNHNINIATIKNAVPKIEPLSRTGNKPYQVFGKSYSPMQSSKGYKAEGIASWYGTKFHGRRTSSGEPYNMYAMSAAHRTLPLPSYARVVNLANNRSVIVKVNDRGPFVQTQRRIMDLSYAAAAKLGVVATGTAKVRIESIQASEHIAKSNYQVGSANVTEVNVKTAALPKDQNIIQTPVAKSVPKARVKLENETAHSGDASFLQMGAFSVKGNAEQLLLRLSKIGVAAYVEQDETLFKVKSGPYVDADQALQQKLQIDRQLNIEARVVFE